MSTQPKPLSCGIDIAAPGGVEKLLDFHYSLFGDATMEEDKSKSTEEDKSKSTEEDKSKSTEEDESKEELPQLTEAGKQAIQRERDARAKADREAADWKRKWQEREDADLSELQRAQKQSADKDTTIKELQTENLRLKALAKHQVPEEYQYLVHGTDEATFLASAKAIADLAKGVPAKQEEQEKNSRGVVKDSGGGNGGNGGNNSTGSVDAGRSLYASRNKKKQPSS